MASRETVTLYGMVTAIRRAAKIPLAVAMCFTILTCISLWMATPTYEAKVSVTSRAPDTNPLSGIGAVGMGLLTGISMEGTLTDYDKFMDVMMSQEAAAAIYSNEEIMIRLFGGNWNAATRSWQPPRGALAAIKRLVNRIFGLPAWVQPGISPVISMLEERLRIIRNDVGTSHTILMRAGDPELAEKVLRTIMESADAIVRDRARSANAVNIEFLRAQLAGEFVVEVRSELSGQLAEALSRKAVLESDAPYSYEILKGYRVGTGPVAPRPMLSLFLAVVAGLIVGAALALLQASNWLRPVSRR